MPTFFYSFFVWSGTGTGSMPPAQINCTSTSRASGLCRLNTKAVFFSPFIHGDQIRWFLRDGCPSTRTCHIGSLYPENGLTGLTDTRQGGGLLNTRNRT